jgi:hypothetical protein
MNETTFVVFFKNVKQTGNDKNTNIHGIQIMNKVIQQRFW